ncbi:DUF7507 domain-containing protein [Aquimarina sp. 433]
MRKNYLFLLFLLISCIHMTAQLSNIHYLPPLKQGGNNQAIRQQAFYLSTPETTAFDVNVFQGTNTTAVATLTISNTAPGKYDVADGDNNITLVNNTNTGVVLSNSGLRFESVGGENFYVNYRGRSSAQGTSLTSKGRQAIGTLFKWGGRPNYGNGQTSLNATLGIMATEPGTTIVNIYGYGTDCEFRLQGDNDGITDDTLTITLTQGQTYVLEAWRNATIANIDCWLGATIQSDKKIAISNGNLNGAPRVGSNSRDAVIDQPVPENVLGREYVFIRGNGVNDIETPIIIGTQNGTDIFVGGVYQTTINTGEYYVIDGSNYVPASTGGNMYVTTTKEVYAYQHLSGSSGIQTGGLNFIAPVNCLLPDNLSNISNIRDVDGLNFNGGITIVAASITPNANIIVTDDTGTVPLANEQTVTGTGDWKTFYIPNLTGNVSVQSSGPIAVGFLGVNSNAGIAGYFSGFDTVPVVELDITGGGCLPGSDVFEITGNFDAYQWFQNGVEIMGATTSVFTPTEPGDFFVRVTRGTCTYNSAILSAYNCIPEIVISKTVDNSPVIEGDTVTFTVTVESLGQDPVSNLVINDILPSELSFGTVTPSFGTWSEPNWNIGDMFPGEVHTLTIEATVNEVSADVTVTNTINNTQTEVDTNALPDDPTEDVTIINNELEITKTDRAAPDGSYDTVGEIITYDFTVTNTGSQIIPSVTISDPNIDAGSLSPASVSNLGIGATANFTATHTITQADIEADQVVNTATAEGTLSNGFVITDISDDPDDPTTITSDPTITPIEQIGALVLEKIAQPAPDGLYDTLGELITYEFTVTNTGNVSLDNVTITDVNIDAGSLSPTSVANLPAGESAVFTATHEIVQLDFDNGNTTNMATATGTEPVEGTVVSDMSDDPTTLAPNDATVVSIPQFGRLDVTKVDDAPINGPYNTIGQTITYTIVATSVGNVTLTDVNVVDPNADTITLISTTGTDTGTDDVVDSMAPMETATFEATHVITQEDLDANQVVNTATVGAQDPGLGSITDLSDDPDDPTTSTNDPTIVSLISTPGISVTKQADDDSNVAEGQTITYTYTVSNTGNVTFDEVSLSDLHSGSGSLGTITLQSTTGTDDGIDNDLDELGPGTNAVWTATYIITATDISNQSDITNTVTASATPRTGSIADPTDFTATEVVTVNPKETICGGQTLSHDLTMDVDPSIVSFSWSTTDNPLISGETTTTSTDSSITDTLINIGTTDQEVIYTITGFDSGGTPQDTYTYTVTVQRAPQVLDTTRTVDICTGDSLNQNLIGHVDNYNDSVNFSWSAIDNANITGETTATSTDDRIQDTLVNTSSVPQDVVYTITPSDNTSGCIGTIYTITVTVEPPLVVPPNDSATVECLADATQPAAPVVTDSSGTPITPVITENTDPTCEGDKVYTYTYTDCAGNDSIYTFTYTIDVTTLPVVPANGTATVECLADATQPTAPIVTDVCGNNITPVITENTDPVCEGDKIYTYTYTDCAGNDSVYTFTYTIDVTTLPVVPANGTATVECIADATQPTAPTVTDVCGNNITPVITENTDPTCEGDKVYTYTYTDCAGNDSVYTFTYTIDVTTLPVVPVNGTATVECLADATQPTAPIVTDVCGNNITPVITENTDPVCEGDKIYTYTYTDCAGNDSVYTFTYTIDVTTLPVVPANGTATVECIADATQPTAPTVTDVCGNNITPVITENTDPVCEGDKIYTYTYTDCAGNDSVYTFTYTIDVTTLPVVPANGTATVECIADATQPTAPIVTDVCGNNITPVITENTDPTCEGDKVYTYTYTDCAGNDSVYTFTYTIDVTTLPVVPANGTATVECIADATQPNAPIVTDVCGNDITPVITENTDPVCEGDKIYTYTYTDCAGNDSVYTFTYTIDVTTLPVVPANGTATVECLADATQPTAPIVTDVCGNDITPVITENTDPVCEGDKVYTYTYTDCAGNDSIYTFTYIIDVTTLPVVPANGTATVECIADATQPTAPIVTDVCGNDITPVITENTDPVCEGDKVYTYTYTDCAGNDSIYTFTYIIDVTTLPVVPANGTATVNDIADAVQPTAPLVTDVCGNNITPIITENPDPLCDGEKIYTYSYTDCAGNTSVYTFTYTIDVTATLEISDTSTIVCSDTNINFDLTTLTGLPDVTFDWVITPNPNINGANNGSGTSITDSIENISGSNQDVIYTITPFNSDGCNGNTFTITITVLPEPFNNTPPSDITCSSTSINHDLTGDVNLMNTTFSWVANDNPNVVGETTTPSNSNSIADVLINTSGIVQTVIYTITPTSEDGCAGNSYNYTVTVNPEAEMVITKSFLPAADGSYDTLGEIIEYEIVINNINDVEINNVEISDMNADAGSITPSNITTIPAMSSITVNASHTITQSDLDAGQVVNSATATAIDPCGNIVNDVSDDPSTGAPNDNTITPILQNPSISLEKIATFNDENGDGFPQESETITYNFTVINTGNVTLINITVSDPVITVNRGPIALAPGISDSTTFTGTYTLTQGDIDSGSFSNSATVSSEAPDGSIISDTSDDPNNPTNDDINGDGEPDDATITTLLSNPELTLSKTGVFIDSNNDGLAQVGETIEYTFDISNTGNVSIFGITISDPLVTINGGPINLSPGQTNSTAFTAIYTLTQDDINTGSVTNSAIASGTDPNGGLIEDVSDDPTTTQDNDDTITTLSRDPQLTLLKTANFNDENGDGFPQIGETINYIFDIRNTGNVTISNITISDPIVTVNGGPINLDPNQSDNTSFTAVYTITLADLNNGSITNSATVNGQGPDGSTITDISDDPNNPDNNDINGDGDPDDSTITTLDANPQISISKTGIFQDENGDGLTQVGETILYAFDIINIGNVTVSNIGVTDPLVTVTGTLIDLDPGQNDNTTFTATYSITQDDIDAGVIQNSAIASGQDPNGNIISDTSDDPNNTDNNDTNGDGEPDDITNTTIPTQGELSLIKTELPASDGSYDTVGEQIIYELTITNTGNVTLTNISVTDANADPESISPATITSLSPGQSTIVNAIHTITQDEIDSGIVNNSASVEAIDPSGNLITDISDDPDNPTDTDLDGDGDPDDITETIITQNPSISFEKIGSFNDQNGDGIPQQGETITYNFNITNTGNVSLSDITISDPLVTVNGGPISLVPGQVDTNSFFAVYTITQSDIDNGSITNSAIITANDTNGNPISDISDDPNDTTNNDTNNDGEPDDTTVTTLTNNPELTIFKTGVFIDANNDGLAQAGETIEYIFDVTNSGNTTITDITITDPLIPVTGGPIDLVPGQTDNSTFTATYILSQSDVNTGEVINTATGSGTDPSGGSVSDTSDDPTTTDDNDPTVTTLARDPELSLFKTANFNDENGDGIPQSGETISYTFDVRNTGNVTITNITITDPIVPVTGGPITLNPAQIDNTSFTALYTILQSDIDSENITNSALVTGEDDDGGIITDVSDFSDDPDNPNNEDLDGDGDPDDPTVTDLVGDPELTLLKIGTFNDTNNDGFAQVGETISYTFEVINSGNTTITDIEITDPLVNVTGGPIDLIPGETDATTFSATYVITQFDVDTGSITNSAVVSGQDPNGITITDNSDDPTNTTDQDDNNDGNPDDDTVTTFSSQSGISISKASLPATDGTYDSIGEQITYSIVITNTGNTTLTSINITDNNADIGSITPQNITILLPGETITASAIHTITQADLDNGIVSNTAIVEATDPSGNIISDISDDPNNPTNTDADGDGDPDDITNTDVNQTPSISLTKAADNAPDGLWDTVGEVITYTLQVTNTGNVTLSNINISDANADVGSIIPADISSLLPGETVTVIAAHTITQQDLDTGSVTNTATVTAEDTNGGIITDDSDDPNNPTDNDTNGDGDPDDATVTSTPQLGTIDILKTVDNITYTEIGDILNYTITITNTGNVTLLNVNVIDPNAILNDPTSIPTLGPGDMFMITGTHVITEQDIINGFVENTAFANATIPNSSITITEDSDDPDNSTNTDIDNDGDPDDPTISYLDTDGDGIPNVFDLDDDNDGITDIEEQNGDPFLDTDGDGIIDSLDLDADGDGIYDYIEAGHDGIDSDGDGTIDGPFGDDGIPDQVQDDPDNGTVDYDPQDSDGDGIDDFQDIDDDNDGILTEDENPDPNGDMLPDDAFDSDGDGIPDYLEPNNSDPTAEDDIEVFNGVTPNGDGNNDVFIIRNIEKFPDNELKIFNRWGVLVYEAIGYGQNQEFFRGESNGRVTISQERQLPVGTYFYVLVYKNAMGISKTRTGYLYINR